VEELATALGDACDAVLRAHVLARDLGYADLAAELAAITTALRGERN
jgi:hypothetical protein